MPVTPPPDTVEEDIEDGLNPNDLFRAGGHVVERKRVEISADRLLVAFDRSETATIANLPRPAWLNVNGVRQRIADGNWTFMPTSAESVRVELTGDHCSNAIDIVAAVGDAFMADVKEERDKRLADTDWTQAPDNALSDGERAAWAAYRALLRNIPLAQPLATLETVVWPEIGE
jgi:hypothetical protein